VGDTITYGNAEITRGVLTTGDAFDCDVNGDGTYDSATERFYYVKDFDDDTSLLLYYNNVSGGLPSNTTVYAYDLSGRSKNGPVTAIKQLPTTSQWSKINFTNTTRAITNENSGTKTGAGTLTTNFSYSGYAARLLTYQEINLACYNGINVITSSGALSSKCKFLYENTQYSKSNLKLGYWLETPKESSFHDAWYVTGSERSLGGNHSIEVASSLGVRPVIEIAKNDIAY